MKHHQLPVGTRVRLRHDVDRYPHFIASTGMTGTVVHSDEHTTNVQMDQHLPGAEEWSNEVQWTDGDYYPILDDVEVIPTLPCHCEIDADVTGLPIAYDAHCPRHAHLAAAPEH